MNKNEVNETICGYWNQYEQYTDKLSSSIRQLAYAEAGVFWILKEDTELSKLIISGLLILVLYFISEVFQYFFGMINYYSLAKKSEEKRDKNRKIKEGDIARGSVNMCAKLFFYLKLFFIVVASIMLISTFYQNFSW